MKKEKFVKMCFPLLIGVLMFVGCAPKDQETQDQEKELRKGSLSISADLLKQENIIFTNKHKDVDSEIWRQGDTLYWKISIDTVGVLGTAKFIGCGCDLIETAQLKLKTEVVDKIHQFAYEANLEARNNGNGEFSLDKEVVLGFEIKRVDHFPDGVWRVMWLAFLIAGIFITYLFYKIDECSDPGVILICIIAGFLISAIVTMGLGSIFFEKSWTRGILLESVVIGTTFIWCLTLWTQEWRKNLKQRYQRKKETKAAEEERIKKQKEENKKNHGMTFWFP